MNEVMTTDEFEDWFEDLTRSQQQASAKAIERLEGEMLRLGYPHSSKLNGAKLAIRELRFKDGDHPIRIAYAFDPARDAVLLIGGDKKGDDRFYDWFVPRADQIFGEYLAENFGGTKGKR